MHEPADVHLEVYRGAAWPAPTSISTTLSSAASCHVTGYGPSARPCIWPCAGSTCNDSEWSMLQALLYRCELVPVDGLDDFEAAAGIYRTCRTGGQSVGRLADCLIAAVAIRTGLEVLHRDRDFDAIARNTALRVVLTEHP